MISRDGEGKERCCWQQAAWGLSGPDVTFRSRFSWLFTSIPLSSCSTRSPMNSVVSGWAAVFGVQELPHLADSWASPGLCAPYLSVNFLTDHKRIKTEIVFWLFLIFSKQMFKVKFSITPKHRGDLCPNRVRSQTRMCAGGRQVIPTYEACRVQGRR